MMKYLVRTFLSSLLLSATMSTELRANELNPFSSRTSTNTENIAKYLLNLGAFLGFDLTQSANPQGATPSQKLVNSNATQTAQISLYETLLGAVPVNTISPPLMQFVPSNSNGNSSYAGLNPLANTTFNNPPYDNMSSQQQGALTANSLIDQQKLQLDPVSQAVLNILATPNYTYCMDNDGVLWKKDGCGLLYDNLVTANVIGNIPGTRDFFTYEYNQQFLSQLNGNTLLSPMLYTTNNGSSTNTSSNPKSSSQNGLPAETQLQQAANFIRYAAGTVVPASLPKLKEYDAIYSKAVNKNAPLSEQKTAQATLTSYFGKLRTYAAQMSVGLSNMYYILSKRMPQNLPGDKVSSQALSEFTMATWRLFNPDQKTPNVQWLDQINNASSATIQKEMVTLLAEINYQLYLNRQQEERLLLTETMMLLQNTLMRQPPGSPLSNNEPVN